MRATPPAARFPDAIVVGAGVVGLSTTLALATRGVDVVLLGAPHPGEASPAAAGMLAPSVERAAEAALTPADTFAFAARDRYVTYLADLLERSGIAVPIDQRGILDVAPDDVAAARVRASIGPAAPAAVAMGGQWLTSADVASLEPLLAPVAGAAFFPRDGAIETRELLRALHAALKAMPGVRRVDDRVGAIRCADGQAVCVTTRKVEYSAPHVILAGGAWTPLIAGLPRALPIEPVRGEIIVLRPSATIGHVVFGAGGYLVPRASGNVLVGSTMERTGFDASTTTAARTHLTGVAATLCPPYAGAPLVDRWAGLRPITPDLLPILGADPTHPQLIYACGHSRSGILLGPLTGDCIAALVLGAPPPIDISAFAVDRFSSN